MVVDVSEWNGSINWQSVKAAGVTHAIIRAGFGKDYKKQDDKCFNSYINGALAAGLKVGVYFYSYAKDAASAKSESAHCLRLIEPFKNKLSLPVFYDCEEDNTKSAVKSTVPIFIKALNDAGYNCGVYASLYWFNNILKGLNIPFRWVASWGSDDGKPHTKPSNCDIWQYTSKGKVKGINGNVDCNLLYNEEMTALIGGGKDQDNNDDNDNNDNNEGGETVNVELKVLKFGSIGGEVKSIQALLNGFGFRDQNGAWLAVDGIFGTKTQYAVKRYQAARGLKVDGIVGVETWNRILK